MNVELNTSLNSSPLLIVISGPSGVGKDSVLKRLKDKVSFRFAVTANTRGRRSDEVDGVDYFFVSKDKFTEMIQNGEMLEYALVYGDYKGVPQKSVQEALASGQDVILRVDVQGALTIKRALPSAILIFLTTEDVQELMRRLIQRDSETLEERRKRIASVEEELTYVKDFDYVVNNPPNNLDRAVQDIACIIRSEHCRVLPRIIKHAEAF